MLPTCLNAIFLMICNLAPSYNGTGKSTQGCILLTDIASINTTFSFPFMRDRIQIVFCRISNTIPNQSSLKGSIFDIVFPNISYKQLNVLDFEKSKFCSDRFLTIHSVWRLIVSTNLNQVKISLV